MAKDKDKSFEQSDLSAIVQSEIDSARNFYRTEISGARETALNYVRGYMPDLRTLPNRSSQVSRDVADTIAWILPGIVRVFTASDQMVTFEARKPGGEQWATDASEFTNYDFMRNNDGYRILYNSTYDALTLKNAVVSSEWVPVEKKRETLRKLTLEQVVMLSEEEGTEILNATERKDTYQVEDVAADELGQPILSVLDLPYYDVKVSRIVKEGHIRDETLKPENFLLNESATTIENARFRGYRYDNKTRSDLMAMADEYDFDTEMIKELPADGYWDNEGVELARMGEGIIDYSSPVRSGDLIDLYRCFVDVDIDGDGIAEVVHVWYAGQKVLAWEVWEDDIPWTDIPCYPVPHRFDGESVADRTMDIQRVKTVLLRQSLDNIYASNVPTQEVEEGSVLNPDALVNKRFGSILWKKRGAAPVVWGNIPFTADKTFAVLPYFDDVIAKRTGVSKTTMALDPEALQNQTATANQNARDAGYSQIELIARNMAELGWARFFAKRLRLAVKYQGQTMVPAPKEDEKFRAVDPSEWDDMMGVNIDVGLGTGSRDRDMAMLNTLMGVQTAMAERLGQVPGGQIKALEFIPKILDSARKVAASSGLRNPENYFPTFDEQDLEGIKQAAEAASQQPPLPVQIEQMKAQASAQSEQLKVQADAERERIKAEGAAYKEQVQAQANTAEKQMAAQYAAEVDALKEGYRAQIDAMKQESDDRRFFAKLRQDRELKLLELGLQETQETAEGGQTQTRVSDQSTALLLQGLNNLAEMINAPTELVRDPETKRVTGSRKVRKDK